MTTEGPNLPPHVLALADPVRQEIVRHEVARYAAEFQSEIEKMFSGRDAAATITVAASPAAMGIINRMVGNAGDLVGIVFGPRGRSR